MIDKSKMGKAYESIKIDGQEILQIKTNSKVIRKVIDNY